MSDPIISDAVVEGGKNVGNAGGLLALGYMIVGVFKKKVEVDDEREAKALEGMLAEMKVQTTTLAALTTKVDVLTERTSGMIARVDKAEGRIEELQREVAELKGKFEHLSEQLIK